MCPALTRWDLCFPSRNLPFLHSLLGQSPTDPSLPFLQQPTSKIQRQALASALEDVCQTFYRGESAFTGMFQNKTAILYSAVSIRIHHLPIWECYYPQHHTEHYHSISPQPGLLELYMESRNSSQNILTWRGLTRILESISCMGQPQESHHGVCITNHVFAQGSTAQISVTASPGPREAPAKHHCLTTHRNPHAYS